MAMTESGGGTKGLWALLWGAIWRARRVEFTYPTTLRRARRVLFLLPREGRAALAVQRWRERLLFALGAERVSVLALGTPLELVQKWSAEPMFFTDADIGYFGIVSGRVVEAVKAARFDVAVDLSPNFDFVTAQIPARAGIPVRIGLAAPDAAKISERFFNIVLFHEAECDYAKLAETLAT